LIGANSSLDPSRRPRENILILNLDRFCFVLALLRRRDVSPQLELLRILPENTQPAQKVAYFIRAFLISGSRCADPNFSFLSRDKFRVFLNKRLARKAKIEFRRMIAKELSMYAGPNQPAISINFELSHASSMRLSA